MINELVEKSTHHCACNGECHQLADQLRGLAVLDVQYSESTMITQLIGDEIRGQRTFRPRGEPPWACKGDPASSFCVCEAGGLLQSTPGKCVWD